MRLKLIVVLTAIVAVFMFMCSFVKSEAPQANYSITCVHRDVMMGFNIYKVTTPRGTYEVMWEDEKGGLCVLK